jgi:hypothetical protein
MMHSFDTTNYLGDAAPAAIVVDLQNLGSRFESGHVSALAGRRATSDSRGIPSQSRATQRVAFVVSGGDRPIRQRGDAQLEKDENGSRPRLREKDSSRTEDGIEACH